MKKKMIPLFLIMALMVFSCKKDARYECLQAKVIRVTCASTVLQVLSNTSIGEDNWVDMFNSNTSYNDVFAVSNACHLPSEYQTGDIVFITIGKPTVKDCIQCAMYDAPPKISFEVKTIDRLPCNDSLK